MITAFVLQAVAGHSYFRKLDPGQFPVGRLILELARDQKLLAVRAAAERLLWYNAAAHSEFKFFLLSGKTDNHANAAIEALLSDLLRSRLPLLSADVQNLFLLKRFNRLAIGAVEHFVESHPLPEALRSEIERLRARLAEPRYAYPGHTRPPTKETTELLDRIAAILECRSGEPPPEPAPLRDGEPWVAAAKCDMQPLSFAQRQKWNALLHHLQSVKASKPSGKWLKQASALADAFGRDILRRYILTWLPIAAGQQQMFAAVSETVLKGLAWAAALFPDQEVANVLGTLGQTCWKKIPGHGPCSKLVGNAVLCSLALIGNNAAVAQLTRINSKLRHRSARTLTDRAFQRIADSTGQSREDLEEISLPTFALDSSGKYTHVIAGFQCTLCLSEGFDASLAITDHANKLRKSVPSEVKADLAFKSLQRTLKELKAFLPALPHRIPSPQSRSHLVLRRLADALPRSPGYLPPCPPPDLAHHRLSVHANRYVLRWVTAQRRRNARFPARRRPSCPLAPLHQ